LYSGGLFFLLFAEDATTNKPAPETPAAETPHSAPPGKIERAGQATGKGVERGAKATERGVKRGVEATGRELSEVRKPQNAE